MSKHTQSWEESHQKKIRRRSTMKIICIGVILFLCLASSLAWSENLELEDDNEGEFAIQNGLDAPNGKCISLQ